MNRLLLVILVLFCAGCMNFENDIKIYDEVFGDRNNPTILLNAGAGELGRTSWPNEFCESLAAKGYFIIRYDYRDTGLSEAVDYEKSPYNLLDLAQDAVKLLDKHKIDKAYFLGFSMGGQLSQIAAASFPDSVRAIILFGTSTDFRPGFDAFEGKFNKNGLSAPDKDYVKFVTEQIDINSLTEEQKVDRFVKRWMMLAASNDSNIVEFFRKQKGEFDKNSLPEHTHILSHSKAMKASFKIHEDAHSKIHVPTLIIQGDKDIIFPLDHAYDLNKKIKGSKLKIVKGLAHALTPPYYDEIIKSTDEFIKATK